MIILRRNRERRYLQSGESQLWLTFYPHLSDYALSDGFGIIAILNEVNLASNGSSAPDLLTNTELVTYVYKGELSLHGPKGISGIVTAGEFQCMTIGRVLDQDVRNTSSVELVHFFRLFLHLPTVSPESAIINAQGRFTVAQRRNMLCTVASPDGRNASLRILPDACIYSSILDMGQHVVHELPQGREAWLHIITGSVTANGVDLTHGDGMGFSDERSISLDARQNTELLLIDIITDSTKTIKQSNNKKFPGGL